MRNTRLGLALALALLGASACDNKEEGASAPKNSLVASPPPDRAASAPTAGGEAAGLRDAVGPAPGGSAGSGRVLFDGARALPDDPEGAGAVYAGAGGGKKTVAYTGEARKDTLKIAEPPAPGSDGAGKGTAAVGNGSGGDGEGGKDSAAALAVAPGGDGATGSALGNSSGGSSAGGKKPRFLLIGDSQTAGHFGRGLDEFLRRDYPGALVETYGQGGSRAAWFVPGNAHSGYPTWNSFFHYYADNDPAKLTRSLMQKPGKTRKTPLIATLLKPDTTVVLVALGSNNLTWSATGKPIWDPEPIAQLADAVKAHGAKCLWLSPADMKGPMVPADPAKPDGPKKRKLTPEQMRTLLEGADAEIKKLIDGKCEYIDKRLPYEGGDGVHLGETRGREVAEAVLAEIKKRVP